MHCRQTYLEWLNYVSHRCNAGGSDVETSYEFSDDLGSEGAGAEVGFLQNILGNSFTTVYIYLIGRSLL